LNRKRGIAVSIITFEGFGNTCELIVQEGTVIEEKQLSETHLNADVRTTVSTSINSQVVNRQTIWVRYRNGREGALNFANAGIKVREGHLIRWIVLRIDGKIEQIAYVVNKSTGYSWTLKPAVGSTLSTICLYISALCLISSIFSLAALVTSGNVLIDYLVIGIISFSFLIYYFYKVNSVGIKYNKALQEMITTYMNAPIFEPSDSGKDQMGTAAIAE
jgi:hypothetical protein